MQLTGYKFFSHKESGTELFVKPQGRNAPIAGKVYDPDTGLIVELSQAGKKSVYDGVLLAASLKIGALLGGASADDAARLYDFGMNMGVAFQLKDDLLDVYGDAAVFGKNIGGDILCNKKTYMLIKALEHASQEHT